MFRKFTVLAGMISAVSAQAQAPAADPARLFGVRESVEHLDISPNGQRVVYLQPGPGRTTIAFVHDLDSNGEPRVVVRSSGSPERLRWCNFVTDDRLVCRVNLMNRIDGVLAPFSRLISVDLDGQNIKLLGERSSFYDAGLRQYDGEIIDWMTGQNGQVLMSRQYVPEAGRIGTRMVRNTEGLGVDVVDVRTARATRVEMPNSATSGYLSDGRGNVRIMAQQDVRSGGSGQLGTRTDFDYRVAGSRDWIDLGSFDSASEEGMFPLAVDPTLDAAYVLRKLNGRFALYRVKLDGTLASELVHANDNVDVDDVVWDRRGSRVIGVTFAEEQRRIVYFDPEYAALARALGRAIPNLPLIDFGGASADGNRIVVHAGSDSDAGRYYVYDRRTRNLNEILMVRPELENMPLASVRSVSYPAADGVAIPAYLTLPPGRDARNLPVVVLPHGGPSARDEWGFDWIAQYLANRGYAVLQPNFRGSAGYGEEWRQQNGYRSWRTSVGDITAGARWLAAEGIGDAGRMAILGWSYGGYAALQAGATDPGLFRGIVAIAPVTDLQQLRDDARNYTTGRNVAETLGTELADGSPVRHVAEIQAPVLLFHGDRDLNVTIAHSERMQQALQGAGRRSDLVRFEGLEHDLADSSARVQMLERIGAFLAANVERPAQGTE
ncbi:MAG: alpha/beta hydrolase family protein [Allosphingosinicella sp.]